MKKLITILSVALCGLSAFAATEARDVTVDFAVGVAPALTVYQANEQTFVVTLKNNQARVDLTNRTPVMWWATSSAAASIVTASCSVVSATAGTFRAVFSPTALNTNGSTFVFGVGVRSNNVTTARIGQFSILRDPFASGASPIVYTTPLDWSLVTERNGRALKTNDVDGTTITWDGQLHAVAAEAPDLVARAGVGTLTTNLAAVSNLAVAAGTWTGSNYATRAYAAGLTNGLIQLGDVPAQTNASFARTGEIMALAAPLTNGYIKAGDVPADNLNWQTQMVERVSTNGAEWGSHAGLYPASNPSGYVDRASATQGMQVAGDYATGTPLYVESDGLPNVLARNNTLGSTNFVWSLGMTNAPLAWTFATTGFSNVPGVVEVPRWADTSYALKFRYRNQDYIPDLPSEQTNFLFMGSLPIVQAGYGLEGSLFKLNGQKVDFLLDSGNIGWFLRANTNLLVISGVNLGGQSITNVATNSIYFTDGTSLSAADVRKAQSSLATNGSGAVLTGITASQVGAVATNDARYLAALTNASAFDAAGSAAGITNGLPSGTNMTGSVFVNGRLTSLGTNAPWAGSMTNLVLSNAAPCSSTFAAGTLTLGTNAASSSGTAYTFLNTNQNAGTVWTNAGSSVVLIGTNVPAGGGISASDATNISASVQSAVAYTPLILTYAATTTLASATNYQALVLTGPVYLALPAVNTNILQTIRLDLIAGTNSVTFAAGITNSANVTISTSKTTPLLFDQPYKQTYWTVYGF